MTRFSPVILIAGAASGLGGACAQAMAAQATGGLILVDTDEPTLEASANALQHPPERVSTLAFDVANAERWDNATSFIRSHYGRLDWGIVCIGADQKNAAAPLAAIGAVRALSGLMRDNVQGGAVVLGLSAKAVKADALLRLVRVAAKEGAHDRVRVNALLNGAIDSPLWRRDAAFEALVRSTGGESAALLKLERMPTPLARCTGKQDLPRLAALLMSDEAGVTGVTLVADSGFTL